MEPTMRYRVTIISSEKDEIMARIDELVRDGCAKIVDHLVPFRTASGRTSSNKFVIWLEMTDFDATLLSYACSESTVDSQELIDRRQQKLEEMIRMMKEAEAEGERFMSTDDDGNMNINDPEAMRKYIERKDFVDEDGFVEKFIDDANKGNIIIKSDDDDPDLTEGIF